MSRVVGQLQLISLPLLNPTPPHFTMSLPVGAAHHALGFLIGAAAGTFVYFWQNQETAFTGDSFSIRWRSTQWDAEVSRTASRPLVAPLAASPAGTLGCRCRARWLVLAEFSC